MLVLARKKEETVVVGEQIEIKVLSVKGKVVRLGITAPNNVKIMRGEIAPFEVELEMDQDGKLNLQHETGSRPLAAKLKQRRVKDESNGDSGREIILEDQPLPNPFVVAQAS